MDQIHFVEPPGEVVFLVCTESRSKTNPHGLKHSQLSTKDVNHYETRECLERYILFIRSDSMQVPTSR